MSENESAHSLHDMGGNIGGASDRASSDKNAQPSAPTNGYSEEVDASVVGQQAQDEATAGSDRGGNANTPPVAGAKSEYISIDETDNVGRGADGETAARLAQREAGEL